MGNVVDLISYLRERIHQDSIFHLKVIERADETKFSGMTCYTESVTEGVVDWDEQQNSSKYDVYTSLLVSLI